ncbi:hypothetical protein [Achromobacter aloeverae]|uniref:ABC transporter permease n=1 Tax=Achromobacter aloeverae TaxID=1750518 RepID=A0A4Q1HL04_9BURK|nr:hypothetical protein [Achromobacter aloeverae]RXN91111.1 hypothetical protein C7R54_07935 [Achromobacter aloeverae]
MPALTQCVRIFVEEQLREPIGIFWSFVAPIAYIVLTSVDDGKVFLPSGVYVQRSAWCLAYVALLLSSTSFGLYLVGRRESGFIRSFLFNPARRRRFILAQYLASLVLALAYGTAFVAVTASTITDMGLACATLLLGKYILVAAVLMFAATFVAALPLTFGAAGSLMSISITIAVVAGLASNSAFVEGPSVLAYLNPFLAAAHFLSASIPKPNFLAVLGAQVILLGTLGVYGVARLRVNPEWSNR